MTEVNVYEVVKKLIGPIEPIGETNTDDTRFKNLVEAMSLVEFLLHDINRLHSYKKRHEYSMKRVGVRAGKFIDEMIEEYSYDQD